MSQPSVNNYFVPPLRMKGPMCIVATTRMELPTAINSEQSMPCAISVSSENKKIGKGFLSRTCIKLSWDSHFHNPNELVDLFIFFIHQNSCRACSTHWKHCVWYNYFNLSISIICFLYYLTWKASRKVNVLEEKLVVRLKSCLARSHFICLEKLRRDAEKRDGRNF